MAFLCWLELEFLIYLPPHTSPRLHRAKQTCLPACREKLNCPKIIHSLPAGRQACNFSFGLLGLT